MRKKLFILIIVVLLSLFAWWIYSIIIEPDTTKMTLIVFGQNELLVDHSIKIVNDELAKSEYKELKEIDFNIISNKTGSGKTIHLKNNSVFENQGFQKMIKDSLSKYLRNSLSVDAISKENANSLVNQMFLEIANLAKDKVNKNKIFIIGSFPECYKIEDLRNTSINSHLKGANYSFMKIVWGLGTNEKRPEYEIYRSLKRKNFDLENFSLEPGPICPEEEPQEELAKVEFVLFSKLENNTKSKALEKIKEITKRYKNIDISFNTFDASTIERINWNNYPDLITRLNDLMNNSNSCDWHKSKFMITTLFEKYEKKNDTVAIFLLGNIDGYKEELIFRRMNRFNLNNNNMYFYLSIEPEQFQSSLTNVFVNRFKYEKIK